MAPKGTYFHIKSKMCGLYLEVKGGGSHASGAVVHLSHKDNGENQIWYTDPLTNTIRNKTSNLCLDVNGSHRLVVNHYKHGDHNQEFVFNKARNTIEQKHSPNKVLDIVGGAHTAGTEICLYDHHGKENQHWELESGPIHYFHIRNATGPKVLDIERANKSAGAKVILYQKKHSASDNQLWFEDCYGNIRSKLNDQLILDGSSGTLHTGNYVEGKHRTFWIVDGTKIVSYHNHEEVLDLKGSSQDDGTEICVWKHHGNANQQWHFDHQ